MEIQTFNFNDKERLEKGNLVAVVKDVEQRLVNEIGSKTEISKDEYINIAARILHSRLGDGIEESFPEYLVCESVVMAIAVRALPNERFEQFVEIYFRKEIRGAVMDLEDESSK